MALTRIVTSRLTRSVLLNNISPGELEEYFGPSYPKIAQFSSLLVDLGIPRGLIGPREADRIWERHILNCAGVCEVLPSEGTILDLGSGAGLPGLIIAIMRPGQNVILLESLQRRTKWLSEMADMLDLANVTVHRGRAGETLKLPEIMAVTARAVAPLTKLMVWSAPILTSGGALYALKGETAVSEIFEANTAAGAKKLIKEWIFPPEILTAETLKPVTPTTIVKVTRK